MNVTPAAVTTFEEYKWFSLSFCSKFLDKFVSIKIADNSSRRNRNYNIFPVPAVAVPALTVSTRLCTEKVLVADICESTHITFTDKNNVATLAAVTAVRASTRNIFFPSERNTAVSAFTGLNFDYRFVSKQIHKCNNSPVHKVRIL